MARAGTPEELLHKAMNARSSVERARHARKGLAARSTIDRETHAMLLRQLYLSHYEAKRFSKALEVAEQAAGLRRHAVMTRPTGAVAPDAAGAACRDRQKYRRRGA